MKSTIEAREVARKLVAKDAKPNYFLRQILEKALGYDFTSDVFNVLKAPKIRWVDAPITAEPTETITAQEVALRAYAIGVDFNPMLKELYENMLGEKFFSEVLSTWRRIDDSRITRIPAQIEWDDESKICIELRPSDKQFKVLYENLI